MDKLRTDNHHPLNKSTMAMFNLGRDAGLYDSQTGLPNRRLWEESLKQFANSRDPIIVLMIDIDNFKTKINDTHGHSMGDKALQDIAEILTTALREEDVIARVGGDEFGVILPSEKTNNSEEHIKLIKERISLVTQEFNDQQIRPYQIGLSVGGVYSKGPGHDMETLVHQSDILMYEEKKNKQIEASKK